MSGPKTSSSARKAFIAAWLGWAFDGLDGYLFILVAAPFVRQLLTQETGVPPDQARVLWCVSVVQCFFLIGWAAGGIVFGRLGDRLGRTRTLTLTVLTYALFTGATFFATAWWHLIPLRFLAALGIGGEWAAGSALVCETMNSRHRAWASATLQSGYMIGCIAASLTTGLLGHVEPRWVFLVGIAPALFTIWIRRAVPEPEGWKSQARGAQLPSVWTLLRPPLGRTTLVVTGLASIALTTVWVFLFFTPQLLHQLAREKGLDAASSARLVSQVSILCFVINIAANYAATYLARWLGARYAIALMFAGAGGVLLIGYAWAVHAANVVLLSCLASFFALGVFGIFPLYIPPLFPTLVRTLGAGVSYNIGRLVSAAGTLAAGTLAAQAGGPARAIWWIGLLYIPGIALALLAPHHREDSSPTLEPNALPAPRT